MLLGPEKNAISCTPVDTFSLCQTKTRNSIWTLKTFPYPFFFLSFSTRFSASFTSSAYFQISLLVNMSCIILAKCNYIIEIAHSVEISMKTISCLKFCYLVHEFRGWKKINMSADKIKLFNTNRNNVDVNAGSSGEESILMICSGLRSLSVLALARFPSFRDFSHVIFPSFNFRHSWDFSLPLHQKFCILSFLLWCLQCVICIQTKLYQESTQTWDGKGIAALLC